MIMKEPSTDHLMDALSKSRKKEICFEESDAFMSRLKTEGDSISVGESYPFGERPKVDFRDKLYLAPLTTVGNLPFRRICKEFGVDITCGEMAMCTNILKGQSSEWALLRRHPSEDIFGVQVCGGWTDSMTRCAEILNNHVDCDFVDVNMGCPIDIVYKKGMGSGLMDKTNRVRQILTGMRTVLKDKPLTVKMRIGIEDGKPLVQKLLPVIATTGVNAITVHGRTRQQRYTKEADWKSIADFVELATNQYNLPLIGNGDIISYEDYLTRKGTGVSSIMIARGALLKPWIFTEIKEQRHWDIRSSERLEMLKRFVRYGLEHFGSDTSGVEKTRRFLLEWQSFLCRYVPIGLLERLPPRMNDRPPAFVGRDDLETLMASSCVNDWVKLSEMLLGPVPDEFVFIPKHKSNSYESNQG
jgi:tRNA-dihydrouridine synthase 3